MNATCQKAYACPFSPGDRVRHQALGAGSVRGEPIRPLRPDPQGRVVWRVTVRWDDRRQPDFPVLSWALTKAC
jgi:hypothetical protein